MSFITVNAYQNPPALLFPPRQSTKTIQRKHVNKNACTLSGKHNSAYNTHSSSYQSNEDQQAAKASSRHLLIPLCSNKVRCPCFNIRNRLLDLQLYIFWIGYVGWFRLFVISHKSEVQYTARVNNNNNLKKLWFSVEKYKRQVN